MRFILLIGVIAAIALGGWSAISYKASVMEADIDGRAQAAIDTLATHDVTADTDGRHITLRGVADTAEEREAIREAAQSIYGRVEVIDQLTVLQVADPFSFMAVKNEEGVLSLTGVVPTAAVGTALEAKAKALSKGKPIASEIDLASGAPHGDWPAMAERALEALAPLISGSATIDDLRVRVTGLADSEEAKAVTEQVIASAGLGTWQAEIDVLLPVASPYAFTARKTGGSLDFEGNAPDEDVSARLRERAVALAAEEAEGEITLANGMPDAGWPMLAERALGALALLENGALEIADNQVRLSGGVANGTEFERFLSVADPGWEMQIDVADPDPGSDLSIRLGPDGPASATGLIPRRTPISRLAGVLPGADLTEVEAMGAGNAADWDQAIVALDVILNRLESGAIRITEGKLAMQGKMKPGFDAGDASAALRTALGEDWETEISLRAAAGISSVTLTRGATGLGLSGNLPGALDVPTVLGVIDASAEGALAADGGGDPQSWLDALKAAERLLGAYTSGEARLTEDAVDVEGALAPGQRLADLRAWAKTQFGDRDVTLDGEESEAEDGDQRLSVLTGELETLRQGFWLPDLDFTANPESCGEAAGTALAAEKITFVTGSARIDAQARALLNRLSAVAIRCLQAPGIALEIAGHTDDVGDDADNLALSQARADAVLEALRARGIDADGLVAIGYGEAEPVADNTTEEGRAQNRRIDFKFTQ
ncbi:MAG: OmpA family protein [Pseudomonadota bacterium]